MQTQFRRINEDQHQQITDHGALDTTKDKNEVIHVHSEKQSEFSKSRVEDISEKMFYALEKLVDTYSYFTCFNCG